MLSVLKRIVPPSFARFAGSAAIGATLAVTPVNAQQLTANRGAAVKVDVVERARTLSMRDSFSRGLYLYMRNNPAMLDNQEFYVNFLIYLMTTDEAFQCRTAFANEFERRDYFTQAFALKEQLRAAVNAAAIPQRFDIGHSIDTGRYDFTTGNLPFSQIRMVGLRQSLSSTLHPKNNGKACATDILRGTSVTTAQFPWSFVVVNEAAKQGQPRFPFGDSLNLSPNDARALFDRFGRQLFAIVGYQFQAANNGDRRIQIIPTDGQLFGLSSDAVVRVKTYRHPTLSFVQSLDMTNPLAIKVPQYNVDMQVTFQQEGFRAVGTGTRKVAGTGITSGETYPVSGSAAVGNSVFVMRLATPNLAASDRKLRGTHTGERYLTLFGSIDREKITENFAPVSGRAILLELDARSGSLDQADPVNFNGGFRPVTAEEPAQPAEPASQLDLSPVTDATPQTPSASAPTSE